MKKPDSFFRNTTDRSLPAERRTRSRLTTRSVFPLPFLTCLGTVREEKFTSRANIHRYAAISRRYLRRRFTGVKLKDRVIDEQRVNATTRVPTDPVHVTRRRRRRRKKLYSRRPISPPSPPSLHPPSFPLPTPCNNFNRTRHQPSTIPIFPCTRNTFVPFVRS